MKNIIATLGFLALSASTVQASTTTLAVCSNPDSKVSVTVYTQSGQEPGDLYFSFTVDNESYSSRIWSNGIDYASEKNTDNREFSYQLGWDQRGLDHPLSKVLKVGEFILNGTAPLTSKKSELNDIHTVKSGSVEIFRRADKNSAWESEKIEISCP